MSRFIPKKSAQVIFMHTVLIGIASAQTTWDAGGGADTGINVAANWNNDTLPSSNGTAQISFGSAGSMATFTTDYFLQGVTLNRGGAFALNSSGGNLVLRSANSSGTYAITMSSGATVTQTINAPIRVDTNNADANKLLSIRNNNPTSTRVLDINGNIARSAGSSVDYQLRYEGVAGSVTRLDGAIADVTSIQQTGNAWAGTLIISGNRSLGATSLTAATTGAGVGAITGSLVLGEAVSEVQSWGTLTLNNGLKVVVGGDVSFAGFVGSASTAIVGTTQAGGASSKLTFNVASTTVIGSTMTLGGTAAGENNLSLIKAGASSLTISGLGTYTGETRVEAGTLRIGAAERIADASLLVLAGGSFDVNGYSETLGGLMLSANGLIDLDNADASATGSVHFADSSLIDWGGFGLSITGTSVGSTAIRFGTNGLGLSAGQLNAITVNGAGGWTLNDGGYLTAIPEPASHAAIMGLLACGLGFSRRRKRS